MKKMFFYAAALCLTAVGFASCTGEDEAFPAAVVSIAEETVEMTAKGGAVQINLTTPTNMAYSVQAPEWITVNEDATVARGVNTSNTFNFVVAPTNTCQERTGVVRIVANNGLQDSFEVVQAGVELAVDMNSATISSAGEVLEVKLTGPSDYTVACPEWVTMNENPAETHVDAQTAVVSFTIAENTETTERLGEIVFTCGDGCGQEVKVALTQNRGLGENKMINYTGKFTSVYEGNTYETTFGVLFDEEDETVVTLCNFEPWALSAGATVDKGMNFVEGQYFPDYNVIVVPIPSFLNIAVSGYELYLGGLNTPGLEETSDFDNVYLWFNEDKSTITIPNAICTMAFKGDNFEGPWDIYAGGEVFTKVAE